MYHVSGRARPFYGSLEQQHQQQQLTCFSPPSRQSLGLEFDEKPTGACSDITYMIMFMSCEADAQQGADREREGERGRGVYVAS